MKWALIRRPVAPAIAALLAALPGAALASSEPSGAVDTLRAELRKISGDYAAQQAQLRETRERLQALEIALARVEAEPEPSSQAGTADPSARLPVPAPPAAGEPTPVAFSGDFRVRYESNAAGGGQPGRDRGVVRMRLRTGYEVSDRIHLGAMISTGQQSNPRTGDVTLSDFGADLPLKLAQAYVEADLGPSQWTAGKMPQPFLRTELVWDGDVNPQGLAVAGSLSPGSNLSFKATGLYFPVDESATGPDSDMLGAQLALGLAITPRAKLQLAAAYYAYRLGSSPGTTPAAFRGNLVGPDGGYLSDFKLADAIVTFDYEAFGPRWPLRLVGDYVRNHGAAVAEDSGFELDVLFGRMSQPGDWRVSYGYAETGVDAVLAAFSTDNTDIATNYVQHALAFDYAWTRDIVLNATAYHYRPKDLRYASPADPGDWRDRLRLNLQVSF